MTDVKDLPVSMIANFTIHDAAIYRNYEKGFFPILKRHGGTFHTLDDASHTFEGAEPIEGRLVMFQFPNEQAARDWYNDPEYQAISEHRRAGTKMRFLTMVHSMPPRK